MIQPATILTIVLIAASTYVTRSLGYVLLRGRTFSPRVQVVLEAVQPCILIEGITPTFDSDRPADLIALALTVLAVEGWRWKKGEGVNWVATAFWCVGMPLLAAALVLGVQPGSLWLQALTTLVLIAPLGPLLYRLVFRPLADASVLILLIVAVASRSTR